MPTRAPRLCGCGRRVEFGDRCPCQAKRDQERKARFDKSRPNSSQRGYDRAWEKAKREWLKAHPFCRRCGAPATTVDHIEPHKGDKARFWDKTNWQSLCDHDHNSAKQREERRASKRT